MFTRVVELTSKSGKSKELTKTIDVVPAPVRVRLRDREAQTVRPVFECCKVPVEWSAGRKSIQRK